MRALLPLAFLAVALSLPFTQLRENNFPPRDFRPVAVPLIVNDPYLSIWLFDDFLTAGDSLHWGGDRMPLTGRVLVDGVSYAFLGAGEGPTLAQKSVKVLPTRTLFEFEGAGIHLDVTFTSPLFVDEWDILARPASYVTFSVHSLTSSKHTVAIYFDITADSAVRVPKQTVQWGRVPVKGQDAMRVGTVSQDILANSGDEMKIDWGYLFVSVPQQSENVHWNVSTAICSHEQAVKSFTQNHGSLPTDDTGKPRKCSNDTIALAVSFQHDSVGSEPVEAHVVVAYDDEYSMDYFGQRMRPYWRRDGAAAEELLVAAARDYSRLVSKSQRYDEDLIRQFQRAGGAEYATLLALSWRQVLGACKLVWNSDKKEAWYFMKEVSSAGDVSTVDVIYPAAPFFLVHAPELLRLQLLPLLDYANNATHIKYNLDWAPHHLGVWPICDLVPDEQEQMPLEETGNMMLLLAALHARVGGLNDTSYLEPYHALLWQWGQYLWHTLPDPGEQLCTDDFEGPSPHNANLAAKGILGMESYSLLQQFFGNTTEAKQFARQAKEYAAVWVRDDATTAETNQTHFRLQYDLPNSWSLKYNLLWQTVLNFDTFPTDVMVDEARFYLTRRNKFGVPLDNRATFTKADWLSWVAALSPPAEFEAFIGDIYKMVSTSTSRVPFTDWYDTETGEVVMFQARPVVGGLWAKILLDESK